MKLKNGLAALAVVCVLWGTTYFAIKIGVESFPPLLFSGIRQIVAAILLLVIIVVTGKKFDWSFKNLGKLYKRFQELYNTNIASNCNICWRKIE